MQLCGSARPAELLPSAMRAASPGEDISRLWGCDSWHEAQPCPVALQNPSYPMLTQHESQLGGLLLAHEEAQEEELESSLDMHQPDHGYLQLWLMFPSILLVNTDVHLAIPDTGQRRKLERELYSWAWGRLASAPATCAPGEPHWCSCPP